MKLTDALLGEHAVLHDLFGHVRKTAATSGDIGEIRNAIAVLERLLVTHARTEETLLFAQLDSHLGRIGPLEVMRAEHRGIDDLLAAAGSATDIAVLKATVGELLDLAQGHFRKEEGVLFGMAEQVLGEAALNELGDQWATARGVILAGAGPGCMGAA
jgi:hemerythrin-like domain-containing protein